ncbi:hypothetical protein QJS04_geneDACA016199 [Acorus gramineus]|uniref:Uncharacterized protein n=1 Tax=Acorus gramineus TaxID=55184 RepID=A0AAV9B5E4_ACOGR|nr:hypothetical protein QJS04_geneDACA016199 [Acorus gramineus]
MNPSRHIKPSQTSSTNPQPSSISLTSPISRKLKPIPTDQPFLHRCLTIRLAMSGAAGIVGNAVTHSGKPSDDECEYEPMQIYFVVDVCYPGVSFLDLFTVNVDVLIHVFHYEMSIYVKVM